MTLAGISAAARRDGLAVLGNLHPGPDDGAPPGCRTLVLLGPAEPGFWPVFRASPECAGTGADPLDRWSERVIGALAGRFAARALFPFHGPPYPPFLAWARASGRAWTSPVGLLVHDTAGLHVSFRGALALDHVLEAPPPGRCPCQACTAPCRTACPVGALGAGAYDVPRCLGYLDTVPGRDCLDGGCAVRRACPVGAGARPPAQSAFHMAAFRGTQAR